MHNKSDGQPKRLSVYFYFPGNYSFSGKSFEKKEDAPKTFPEHLHGKAIQLFETDYSASIKP